MTLSPELLARLKYLARLTYVVTDEEDRLIQDLNAALSVDNATVYVYDPTAGLTRAEAYIADWKTGAHPVDGETVSIHDTLIKIYKDDSKDKKSFYVILDAERWLSDAHITRRVLRLIHQLHNDPRKTKLLIFVGRNKVIPDKLSSYMQVVDTKGLSKADTQQVIETVAMNLKLTGTPSDATAMFAGLTSYQIDQAMCMSSVAAKTDLRAKGLDPKTSVSFAERIDPRKIAAYRRQQMAKTDLVLPVDVSQFSFEQVGGAERFKGWVDETRLAWTEEGRAFGLRPPKGVLCVGVWGCGKSLSVKAMGAAWGLPVVSLEMGRLRSSGVGESEANVYRAIRVIESIGPCLVWIDEAEKSLAGNASSGQTDAGTTARTIGILSTWLQETQAHVCLAMTANSLNGLPVEFVNRLDERFFFDLPAAPDRVDILKIHLIKRGQDPKRFNLADLAEKAKGLVGREIEQAIGAAMTKSFAAKKDGLDEEILGQVLATKPRILKTMGDEVKAVIEWVGYDPDADDGVRARFASKPDKQGALKVYSGG